MGSSAHSGCPWAQTQMGAASLCCWSWLASSRASTHTSAHMQREFRWGGAGPAYPLGAVAQWKGWTI